MQVARKLIPKGNGCIAALLNQMQSFRDVIADLDKKLVQVSKNFMAENNLNDSKTEEMNYIRREVVIEFSNSLRIPGITAR